MDRAERWNDEVVARIDMVRAFIEYVKRRETAYDRYAFQKRPFRMSAERWSLTEAASELMRGLIEASDRALRRNVLAFYDLEESGCSCLICMECRYDTITREKLLPAISAWKTATDDKVLAELADGEQNLSSILARLVGNSDGARERLDDAFATY